MKGYFDVIFNNKTLIAAANLSNRICSFRKRDWNYHFDIETAVVLCAGLWCFILCNTRDSIISALIHIIKLIRSKF